MHIAVIGSGYVGVTTGVCFAALGHDVVCVDLDQEVIEALNSGHSHISEPGLDELLRQAISDGRFRATTDMTEAVPESDLSFICVGTPASESGIDLTQIKSAATQIGDALPDGGPYHVVVVKSTVVPGTTEDVVSQILREISGRDSGALGVCTNPEFLREGSAVDDFMVPDRIVIGQSDERAGMTVATAYESLKCSTFFTTSQNAELTKYAANSLLATLISFSNEIGAICEATPSTSVEDVLGMLHLDRRLSPVVDGNRIQPGILSYLAAGAGFGGSCLPKDIRALRAFARGLNTETALLDAVSYVNDRRPGQLVTRLEKAVGGDLQGKEIAVLGLSFKPGTDDTRESSSLKVAEELEARGAKVRAHDPVVKHGDRLWSDVTLSVRDTLESALDGADGVVLVTAWPEFAEADWSRLCGLMANPVIVDGRNALRHVEWPSGATYLPVGESN